LARSSFLKLASARTRASFDSVVKFASFRRFARYVCGDGSINSSVLIELAASLIYVQFREFKPGG
jgi:hypothetical protein